MLRSAILTLTLLAASVASHESDHSAQVHTTVMVMDGQTTTMVMTATDSSMHMSGMSHAPTTATAAPQSTGRAASTNIPAQAGALGLAIAALVGVAL
ncbi:Nn.00g012480.m01.CDS01 [Neocucurbitaria sp. VM-36]